MSQILLGQSYFLRFDPKLWEAMQPLPPLGSLYAAAVLRERGCTVELFDAMLAEDELEWEAALAAHRPQIAILFEDNFNYLSKMCLLRMRQAAAEMIKMAVRQGCTVIVAGADVTDHPELYLHAGADWALLGEGDSTLGELVDHLSGRSSPSPTDILGLAWLEDGRMVRTQSRQSLRDLDQLPMPAWDLVDISRYEHAWRSRHGYFAMNLVTTRGCPYHCNWCAKPIWGQRYASRSPANVAAEMKMIKDRFAPDMIWFADDIFGLKPGWTEQFAAAVDAVGARIPFKCLSRADLLLRPGEIDALRRAGARIVWVGAESGSQAVLDAMEKGIRVEQITAAADWLHQAGIGVGFFLQFGYPGEGWTDIEKTLQMVRSCRPDDIGISVSYPLPGTRFYASVRDQLGSQQNWYDSDDLAMLYRGPFTTDFYRQLHRVVHTEYRRDRAWRTVIESKPSPVSLPAGLAWRGRELARSLALAARLPVERRRLNRLRHLPHTAIDLPSVHLPPDLAAVPTPQDKFRG